MVKVLVTVPATVTQLPGKKLLAGAVYKRQRKLPNSTSQSSHPGLPDRKPSNPPFNCGHQSGSKPEIRPPVLHVETDRQTKSLQRPRAIQKPPKGKHQSDRTTLQLVPQYTDASDDSPFLRQQDYQPSATWGLTQEARYFAELDTELLVEDEQELSQSHSQVQRRQEQKQVAAEQNDTMCATSNQTRQLQMHASTSDSHQPIQTPGALALIKYHPDLQARYKEYVCCMDSNKSLLTPMPLEDFCKLAGKDARGLPVFNT